MPEYYAIVRDLTQRAGMPMPIQYERHLYLANGVTLTRENGGKPDLEHSLNRLSLPGVPIRLWAEDPLDRDMFFRFNGSLQEYVNESYKIPTRYLVE